MSTKIAFSWRCPKGHNVDDSLPKAELRDQLTAGRLTAVALIRVDRST